MCYTVSKRKCLSINKLLEANLQYYQNFLVLIDINFKTNISQAEIPNSYMALSLQSVNHTIAQRYDIPASGLHD